MTGSRPASITLGQFLAVFILFGLGVVFMILWPEATDALSLNRTKAAIWVTTILLAPAFALHPFGAASQATANYAALFWTAANLVFLVHAYWAVFIIFGGIAHTFKEQGKVLAGINFLLVAWWTIDAVLLWVLPARPWLALEQAAVRLLAFLVFAITLLFLRGGSVRMLGIAFAAVLRVIVRSGVDQPAGSASKVR
jgi:hypothetical protein